MASEKMSNIVIRVSLIVLAAVVVIFLISYYSNPGAKPAENSEKTGIEKFNETNVVSTEQPIPVTKTVKFAEPLVSDEVAVNANQPTNILIQPYTGTPMPTDPNTIEDYIAVDYVSSGQQQTSQFPQDRTTPEDLLPRDAANSKWAQVAPAGQGDVKNQNFLTAGFHIGKDTIGVAKKNPNLTLRAEPPNPKTAVSPWMNSSIEPDNFRRGFEMG